VLYYHVYVAKKHNVFYGIAIDKEQRIAACGFSFEERGDITSKIMEHLPQHSVTIKYEQSEHASKLLKALSRIYEGGIVKQKFNLSLERFPSFTRKVLRLTSKIPRGFVTTYGLLAEATGNKRAARAVGNVEARNPFAPIVPCHRVVSTNLSLGGYGHGLNVKRRFLEREGVVFKGVLISKKCLWIPVARAKQRD
jgi:methylated-DNA-[protein]-cysteine S-methyltransferase